MRALVNYFLLLGATKFGGPIALAGAMQRDLVDERKWITREEYLRGLALAQLAPGPLAAQLAIYLGWVRGGVAGATLVDWRSCCRHSSSSSACRGSTSAFTAWRGCRRRSTASAPRSSPSSP